MPLTCNAGACCDERGVFPKDLLEVEPSGSCSLFFFDFCVVELDEGLQFAHNVRSVVRVVRARVVREPEDAEVRKSRQMGNFLQVANVILPNVDFLKFLAVGKVF